MREGTAKIENLCVVIIEWNLGGNQNEWWFNSITTRYVCTDKEFFATYNTSGPREVISMKNTAITMVEKSGKMFLKMTFRKKHSQQCSPYYYD